MAGGAVIQAVRLVVGQRARIGAFGARFAQHVILRRGQALAPFGFRKIQVIHGVNLVTEGSSVNHHWVILVASATT